MSLRPGEVTPRTMASAKVNEKANTASSGRAIELETTIRADIAEPSLVLRTAAPSATVSATAMTTTAI